MNLNDWVEVTLTETGADTFNDSNVSIRIGGRSEGETARMQLWELMQIFGGSLSLAAPIPFIGNEVRPLL